MQLPNPINGTEQFLQAIHQELVGLRADLAAKSPSVNPSAVIPGVDPATVDLKEPGLSPTVAAKLEEAKSKPTRKKAAD